MGADQLPVKPGYKVGYAKPPAEHRFEKGKSGNPRGRPKEAKNKVPSGQGLEFGTQPANRMLLEEAYRTITVREGERVIELPVMKAVFRAMGVSAMKGNRLAQAAMAELVRGIEEQDRKLRSDHMEAAIEYKTGWDNAIEIARQRGLPEPTPLPHPADVIIDLRSAEVRYTGPMTPEDKQRWDRALEFRDDQQREVTYLAKAYRVAARAKAPDIKRIANLESYWKRAVELYDRINGPLPERYQKRLSDRFYPSIVVSGKKGDDV